MIKFAAICPHPPLLVPEVGSEKDLRLVNSTVKAMEKLADDIEQADIDTIVIITPHNMVFNDQMTIFDYKKYAGNFEQFGKHDIGMKFDADNDLIDAIVEKCEKEYLPNIKFNNGKDIGELDHGAMVPLYYLTKYVGDKVRLVLMTYSYQERSTHIKFGEIIGKVCSSEKFHGHNIAVIAPGDMSHRLFSGAPAGFSSEGKEFDQMMVKDLKNNDTDSIIHYDEDWVDAAGECGYRSILILLGALSKIIYNPKILSYEGPFGVGYIVVNFELK